MLKNHIDPDSWAETIPPNYKKQNFTFEEIQEKADHLTDAEAIKKTIIRKPLSRSNSQNSENFTASGDESVAPVGTAAGIEVAAAAEVSSATEENVLEDLQDNTGSVESRGQTGAGTAATFHLSPNSIVNEYEAGRQTRAGTAGGSSRPAGCSRSSVITSREKPRRLSVSFGEPASQMNDHSFLNTRHHTGTPESSLDSKGSRRSRRKNRGN